MRASRTYGFMRGAHSNMRPYRDPYLPPRAMGRQNAMHRICQSLAIVSELIIQLTQIAPPNWIKRADNQPSLA